MLIHTSSVISKRRLFCWLALCITSSARDIEKNTYLCTIKNFGKGEFLKDTNIQFFFQNW